MTSQQGIFDDALRRGVPASDLIFVDREDPTKRYDAKQAIPGTNGYFQFRGVAHVPSGEEGEGTSGWKEGDYPIAASCIPCGCDLCLKGGFRGCPYLKKRGGVIDHKITKV